MIHCTSFAVVANLLVALAVFPAAPLRAGDKPTVVATFSVLGDMVANVAGDHVDLVTIVGPDGDTELYRPSLADGRAIAGARIVFMNDLNDEFEPWLEPLRLHQGAAGTRRLDADRDDGRSSGEAPRHLLSRFAGISREGLRHYADIDLRLDKQK
jgi:ABC-type Zn uptake system ZnuABC Zn-binding protein ZnuA